MHFIDLRGARVSHSQRKKYNDAYPIQSNRNSNELVLITHLS